MQSLEAEDWKEGLYSKRKEEVQEEAPLLSEVEKRKYLEVGQEEELLLASF